MQNGRPLSPRAQAASAGSSAANESAGTRREPGRSLGTVETSTSTLPSTGNRKVAGRQFNDSNETMATINLPHVRRLARQGQPVITIQPHPSRCHPTVQSERNETSTSTIIHNSLPRHPRLTASDTPPIVPPRPESTLTSKSRLTRTSALRTGHTQHQLCNSLQSSGPGRGVIDGGTLISLSQNVNLPSVSPPPVPITASNTSSTPTPPNISSSNVNITPSHSQSSLVALVPTPSNISLVTPRPGPERVQNLYVDAPLKGCVISNTQRSIEPLTSTSSRANDINNLQSTTILSPATIRTLPHSTSNSSVNFSKCRKDTCNLSNKQLHSVTGVHRTKTPASTNSSLHNHHCPHHHHSHHHQKSQPISSKLSNHSVIHQQPTNHLLLQSSPSTLDLESATLKKKHTLFEEGTEKSPMPSHTCKKCTGFRTSVSNQLFCPNHHSSLSSSMSEQPEQQSSNIRFNMVSTLESPLPRPTSTLPTDSSVRIDQSDSIICRECGRCRCEACRAPRKLPEYWLCGNACVCSSETIVDTISCMCCVKTMFYHCGKDCYFDESTVEDSTNAFDRPCSCTGEHACARWSFMGLLGLVLPCLWCYLPLRGCANATQGVYQRCTATGCRCSSSTSPNIEAYTCDMPTSTPPKMSDKFIGGKNTSSPMSRAPSSGFVNNNSFSDNSSSLTSSPTIPSLPSPADSEKRLLE